MSEAVKVELGILQIVYARLLRGEYLLDLILLFAARNTYRSLQAAPGVTSSGSRDELVDPGW
jgi:hypothetical protein